MTQDELNENIKKLILARLMIMPSDLRLSIGSQDYTKEDLKKHIEENDSIGNEYTNTQLEFLQDLASGAVYQNE